MGAVLVRVGPRGREVRLTEVERIEGSVAGPAVPARSAERDLVAADAGVLSQELVAKALDDLTHNETGPRRKLTIHRYRKVSETQNCHILFIDQSIK